MTSVVRSIAGGAGGYEVAEAQASFEEFFEHTHHRLFAALCLLTANRHEAEEIMQDAYLKLWEQWDRAQRMDHPSGFLFTTAMNLFRSRYRRVKVGLRRRLWFTPAAEELAEVEDRDEVVRILRSLPPAARASIVLTRMFGYSSEEAGRMLGVRSATVRAYAARALADLREHARERS